jgi:hypothetical protein
MLNAQEANVTQNAANQSFQFRCMNGDLITVRAGDESHARHFAMVERWGPPSGIYGGWYEGRGLTLVEQW